MVLVPVFPLADFCLLAMKTLNHSNNEITNLSDK